MTWNYRIIEFADCRSLHEVHYDGCRPTAYTKKPISFVEGLDEADGIVGNLELALRDARDLPVLPVGVFDLPVDERPITPRRA